MSTTIQTIDAPRTISSHRRTKDRLFSIALWASVVVALVPLLFIVYRVVRLGVAAVSVSLFAHTALPASMPGGGMKQAFLGTAMIVGIAIAISVPLGILTGIYLSEYGSGRIASLVRFTAEILLSIPSTVAGPLIWAVDDLPLRRS